MPHDGRRTHPGSKRPRGGRLTGRAPERSRPLWTSYKDPFGQQLNVRPHWAKEWQGIALHHRPAISYLREHAYADSIPRFRAGLRAIAKQGGYTASELRMFSNPLLDDLFHPVFE